jgi:energy-converting hydrogenase Eha subunit H
MATSPSQSRSLLAACAALVVVVALVVAVGVIPQVRVANVPDISPESAVLAFWVSVGLHVLAALVLALTATLSKGRSKISTSVLVVTAIAILLLGFLLSDAALAFREAGPSMRTVTTLLFLCVAADVLAGALTLATAFLRPARA